MDLQVGDIVLCDSPIAGHAKYHICVLACGREGQAACFLFLNSEGRVWKGDSVFENGDFPFIPPSRTGKSVVSLSLLVRYDEKKLRLYRAKKIGRLSLSVARRLESDVRLGKALPEADKKIVLAGLSRMKAP